ncbi:MAG: hypothetical protein ACI9N9_000313 [Enterobacterales bacterium]|jgi:hypothetical protein
MNLIKNSKLLIVLLSVLLVCVAGCSPAGSENDVNPERSYKTVTIEGHEYIFITRRPWGGEMAIAHKANCKAH